MRKSRVFVFLSILAMAAILLGNLSGCGTSKAKPEDPTEGRPSSVSAYEAIQYTKPVADKWQPRNWMIQVRSGDPDGLGKDGKSKIWEVYFFSPVPEQDAQMFVIYNRGNVWPNAPGIPKGGDNGLAVYRKEKPPDFRVDSGEALQVANQNGGGTYLDSHPDAKADAALRCKADYDAVGEKMPGSKYDWIWDVSYREPRPGAEVLHVLIDGMNGDFITKNVNAATQ